MADKVSFQASVVMLPGRVKASQVGQHADHRLAGKDLAASG